MLFSFIWAQEYGVCNFLSIICVESSEKCRYFHLDRNKVRNYNKLEKIAFLLTSHLVFLLRGKSPHVNLKGHS